VPNPRPPLYRSFLDTQQYSDRSIALYERVYGQGFVSPGGADKAAEILQQLHLQSGMKVLDVGCGTGGKGTHVCLQHLSGCACCWWYPWHLMSTGWWIVV
jgi:cyclopropane fatty-acyl-phospholipid synthase-like methyltransferase